MKNVTAGILCSVLCTLTACGGGGGSSGDKPKSSSSVAVSSSSVAVSSEAISSVAPSSTPESSSSEAASSVAPSSTPASSVASTASSDASSQDVSSSAASVASSSSVNSSSAPVALTGVFIDSAVAGVAYETSPGGFTGFTSATGQYQFAEGDTVVFSIGDLKFPEVLAKGVVTPVDIAESADLANADRIKTNIAALLQSLDVDGDPDNGISIDYNTAETFAAAVDFNQPYADFAALPAVTSLVANSGSSTTALVSESAAVAHLKESLAQVNAKALIGTWYINGYDEAEDTEYNYVLFVTDEHHYAFIDQYGGESELEVGTYSWNQENGEVTTGIDFETESALDSNPPMASGNTLELDGDTLTFTDEDETFVATRLMPSQESPLKGGWSIEGEVFFAFTDTHYFMGQYTEAEEDNSGYPGIEIGSYSYNSATKAITYATLMDTNGQWGLSHPCAIISDNEHPQYEDSNFFNCGPNGDAILQTIKVTGDTLTFTSEADTIANDGEEEPTNLVRINGLPDGDTHVKLNLTLTLTAYTQGTKFEPEGGTMQCDLNSPREIGEIEELQENWVLGGNPARSTWVSTVPATYDPETKKVSFDVHEAVKPVPGHEGFYEEFWETLDATYNPGETNVITGTYSEKYNLTWDRGPSDVSTCTATYSVVGVLR